MYVRGKTGNVIYNECHSFLYLQFTCKTTPILATFYPLLREKTYFQSLRHTHQFSQKIVRRNLLTNTFKATLSKAAIIQLSHPKILQHIQAKAQPSDEKTVRL